MSNIAVLTRSHTAIAAKKKARKDQIKEIVFDDEARRDFLTGFHKRKLAKADAARKKAIEREKQERLESRREQRRMLRERAAENAAFVEGAYGGTVEAPEEWTGITPSSKGKQKQQDQEYEDEDVLATVAVVEDFDPDTLIHGPSPETAIPPSSESAIHIAPPVKSVPRISKFEPSRKTKPKKVHYETKDARKTEKSKQHARKLEKAELAGGRASRKSSTRGKGKGRR